MGTLGNQSTGFLFTVSSTFGDIAGGSYTVPSPGIIVTGINGYVGNNGSGEQGRFYVWQDSGGIPGAWLIRGHTTFTIPSSSTSSSFQGTLDAGAGVSSDLYLPAGTVIWVGCYCASGTEQIQANSASGGGTRLGNTADGNWNDHSAAGLGQMAAWINYNPLAAPTISGISPSVAPPGSSVTISGTGFLHASGVTIGGVGAAYSIVNDTTITATVPSGVGGVVTVVVTNPAGSASSSMTAGQIYYGDASGSGAVHSIVAIYYGDPSGSGAVHQAVGVWVNNGSGGVKRVW